MEGRGGGGGTEMQELNFNSNPRMSLATQPSEEDAGVTTTEEVSDPLLQQNMEESQNANMPPSEIFKLGNVMALPVVNNFRLQTRSKGGPVEMWRLPSQLSEDNLRMARTCISIKPPRNLWPDDDLKALTTKGHQQYRKSLCSYFCVQISPEEVEVSDPLLQQNMEESQNANLPPSEDNLRIARTCISIKPPRNLWPDEDLRAESYVAIKWPFVTETKDNDSKSVTPTNNVFCECGYPQGLKSPLDSKELSNMCEVDTSEMSTFEFGNIQFQGIHEPTKYIRIPSETSPDILHKLIANHWQLKTPKLIISVAGGGENLPLKTPVRKKFRQIISIAMSRGSWILTRGKHYGLTKYIGQVVTEYTLCKRFEGMVTTIGFAAWHTNGSSGKKEDTGIYNQLPPCLDENHTYQILVHDKSGADLLAKEILRGRFEKFMSEYSDPDSNYGGKVPVVCFVQGGDLETLGVMYNSIKNKIPCVVLAGSGYIADVIASLIEFPPADQEDYSIKERLAWSLPNTVSQLSKEDLSRWIEWIFMQMRRGCWGTFFPTGHLISGRNIPARILERSQQIGEIVQEPNLLTVLKMEEAEDETVRNAISFALFKAFIINNQNKDNWETQMKVLFEWDNVDQASKQFFSSDKCWKSTELHEVMCFALAENRPKCVRLLLENGLNLELFLSWEVLKQLFCESFSSEAFENLSKTNKCYSDILVKFVYEMVTMFREDTKTLDHSSCKTTLQITASDPVEEKKCSIPGHQVHALFIWAVLQTKQELAEVIWEKVPGGTAAALGASNLLKRLVNTNSNDIDEGTCNQMVHDYESRAAGLLSECFSSDRHLAEKVLFSECRGWGKKTCFDLAFDADYHDYITLPGIQEFTSTVWFGGIASYNPIWKVLLCVCFFPLVAFDILSFSLEFLFSKEEIEKNNKTCLRYYAFFNAPIVIFSYTVIFYIAFLLLFAYVLLMNFQPVPTGPEILLYVLVFIRLCEEIWQFCEERNNYLKDIWNIMDVVGIAAFVIAISCRLNNSDPKSLYAGRVILSLDFIIFAVRLIYIFIPIRSLGPKIIMLQKMMLDVLLFLFLFVIWALAFGVARQGILRHNEQRWEWIFRSVFYEPFRALFAEFPSDMDSNFIDLEHCTRTGNESKPLCVELDSTGLPMFPDWVTIPLLCVYMLFINIMLVNLLIALLSHTVEAVQAENEKMWGFQRFFLVSECSYHPPLPFPFVILSYIYLLVRKIQRQRHKKPKETTNCCMDSKLLTWEDGMRERYLAKRSIQNTETNEELAPRFQKIEEQLKNLTYIMDSIAVKLK